MNTNIAIIEGNLGRDPETRFFQSGKKVVQLAVGVSRKYTTNNGEEKEETSWVDVKAFGAQADIAAGLSKGSRVLVIGEIRQECWVDKQTNQNRSKLVVIAGTLSAVQRVSQGQPAPQGYAQPQQQGYYQPPQQQGYPPQGYGAGGMPQGYPPPPPPPPPPPQSGQYVPSHPVADSDLPPAVDTNDTPF